MGSRLWFLLFTLVLVTSCRKDVMYCAGHSELTARHHLADIGVLGEAPIMLEILENNPQLQVRRVINDQYSIGMHCNVFHEDLLIFTAQHIYVLGKIHGMMFINARPVEVPADFVMVPAIDHVEAIAITKEQFNFDHTCIEYRLGIWDVNAGRGDLPVENRLAWKVQGTSGYPNVVVDAQSGAVITKDNGIRY